jgi:hypothetical protein
LLTGEDDFRLDRKKEGRALGATLL